MGLICRTSPIRRDLAYYIVNAYRKSFCLRKRRVSPTRRDPVSENPRTSLRRLEIFHVNAARKAGPSCSLSLTLSRLFVAIRKSL